MRRTVWVGLVALVVPMGLTACADDDDGADGTVLTDLSAAGVVTVAPAATTLTPGAAVTTVLGNEAGPVVAVLAADYSFGGIPGEVAVGSSFTLQNDSTEEVHEMVVIRIPDEETRPVAEIAALTEEEQDAIFGDTEPAFVIVAPPGEQGVPVLGDGTVTETGRYAVVCFIPVGADPAEFMAAMQEPPSTDPNATEGPPDVAGGPPHVTKGMYAEFRVA